MKLDALQELATGLDHPEGITWGTDGRVYAGGEAGQIYAISLDGAVEEVASTGGFIYGVTTDGDGSVYACDFGRTEVSRISPSGIVETYSKGTADHPLRVPNFSCFGDDGNLYVTDSGDWGADDGLVFRIERSGATVVWSDAVPRFPNGCCLSADGDRLYVIESHGRNVTKIPIRDDGSAGAPEVVVELPGSQPDGIALAADGTLFVGCYRPDRVYRVGSDGTVEVLVEDPDGVALNQPTNVAFIGPELDRLAIASLGGWSLVVADVGIRGLPLRYPRL